MFTLTSSLAFDLVNNLIMRDATRYTYLGYNKEDDEYFYLTIVPYPSIFGSNSSQTTDMIGHIPNYIVSFSPVGDYTGSLVDRIQLFSIFLNETYSQMLISEIFSKTLLSYSITKSVVYLYLNESRFQLQFVGPYVNDSVGMKESILNLFGFPTVIFLIDNRFTLQFNWIEDGYELSLQGLFVNQMFYIANFFDFNRTLVISESNQMVLYSNTSTFHTTNMIQELTYSSAYRPGTAYNIVIGFNANYLIRKNPGLKVDDVTIIQNLSNNTDELSGNGLYYHSLAKMVPLTTPLTFTQEKVLFYLNGVSGLNFKTDIGYQPWAVIQVLDIFNIDTAYNTISARLMYTDSKDGLIQYEDTTLWYLFKYDPDTFTFLLVVYETLDDSQPGFFFFLSENRGTIMTSDLLLITKSQVSSILQQMSLTDKKKTPSSRDTETHNKVMGRRRRTKNPFDALSVNENTAIGGGLLFAAGLALIGTGVGAGVGASLLSAGTGLLVDTAVNEVTGY